MVVRSYSLVVRRELVGVLQRPTVVQVGGDGRRAEGVTADIRLSSPAGLYLLGVWQIRGQGYLFERHTGTTRLAPAFLESDANGQVDEC